METHFDSIGIYPASLYDSLVSVLNQFSNEEVIRRLWEHDHTLWSTTDEEIRNRLDWLHLPDTMPEKIHEIQAFAEQIYGDQFEHMVLLGMGGSSLAPEMLQAIFGNAPGYPELIILDSTDPGAILKVQSNINLEKSIFIVATKSGGTVETLSLFKYFYVLLREHYRIEVPGQHFIAITDPGSRLEQLGKELQFRKIFLNNPNIGGRYSALSYFGLVPAALIGLDIRLLLSTAKNITDSIFAPRVSQASFAVTLGALLGAAGIKGIDKLTFISNASIASFSDWVEQLIAESTGKSGKGILPVVDEKFSADLLGYGPDRMFVVQQYGDDQAFDRLTQELQKAGFPVIHTPIKDKYELGGLIMTWEIATALAGHVLQIHPFNQPNVESAKILAKNSMDLFKNNGILPESISRPLSAETIEDFLLDIKTGDYICIQAFVTPSTNTMDTFRSLQATLRDKYKTAVTFGFGPRFLHSTGQLHKGDSGNGYFLQFVSTARSDISIPTQTDSSASYISFDILKQAQAIGDAEALRQANRKLVTFILDEPVGDKIKEISARL